MPAPDLAPLPESLDVTSIVLNSYTEAGPVPLDAFEAVQSTLRPGALGDGEALAETLYLSVDPYMRPRMCKAGPPYMPSFKLGEPLSGSGVALVRASKAPGLSPGDVIIGRPTPWATFFVVTADQAKGAQKVPPELLGRVPLSYFVGTLGMPGLTAFSSIRKIAEPKPGDSVYISAASGAVGQVAGQLFKHVYGCRVAGSAGGPEKVQLLRDLGYDAAWDHREVPIREALKAHCPGGVDIYFENVGGETLEAVLDACNTGARIVACGMISQYDLAPEERYGVKNLFLVVGKQIKMQGFIVGALAKGMEAEFARDMADYVTSGKVKVIEHVTEGLEGIGAAFAAMMRGGNLGKAVVKVAARDPYPAAPPPAAAAQAPPAPARQ